VQYDLEASSVHFNFSELVLFFSHVNCRETFYVFLTWMTIAGDTLQSLLLKDKYIHLLNIFFDAASFKYLKAEYISYSVFLGAGDFKCLQ
jgi:hypothetical protein